MSGRYFHPDSDFIRKLGAPPPVAISHEIMDTKDNPLSEQLIKLKPKSWHLEGNQLVGMTEMGPLVQTIPTDYILEGTDENSLPIFRKVIL